MFRPCFRWLRLHVPRFTFVQVSARAEGEDLAYDAFGRVPFGGKLGAGVTSSQTDGVTWIMGDSVFDGYEADAVELEVFAVGRESLILK